MCFPYKLTECCGKTEWWGEIDAAMSDVYFSSVFNMNNVPFTCIYADTSRMWVLFQTVWSWREFPVLLILWARLLQLLWESLRSHRQKLRNTGVGFLSLFSPSLRWYNLSQKDCHSRPNLSLLLCEDECGGNFSLVSSNTVSGDTKSHVSSDNCLLVPTKSTSFLMAWGAHVGETQNKQNNLLRFGGEMIPF